MRFTNRCETSGCMQWTGSRCGVIDRAMALLEEPVAAQLAPCTIRATCRWFDQTGPSACSTCALIVTDTRENLAMTFANCAIGGYLPPDWTRSAVDADTGV